jgi:hypothetical protein
MAIKSQQDIKNANEEKKAKVPKSMEGKVAEVSHSDNKSKQPEVKKQLSDEDIIAHINAIEIYLQKADKAFSAIAVEMEKFKRIEMAIQTLDVEVAKLTGNLVRLTQLDEDRYVEVVAAVHAINSKLTEIDETIPSFIDQKLADYFEEIEEQPDNSKTPT